VSISVNLWPAPNGVGNPVGKSGPDVDAVMAQQPVDWLDGMLRDSTRRFGQTLPYRMPPHRCTGQQPQGGIGQRQYAA
jgi:hypothetical protein